jgi:predicted transcriptional regulator
MNKEVSINKTKEQAMEMLSSMPEEVGWQDLIYRFYVRLRVEEGVRAAEEGRIVSHEDVKRLFAL